MRGQRCVVGWDSSASSRDCSCRDAMPAPAPNTRLQLTAFGARDRGFFEVIVCCAPRRQLKRNPFGTRGGVVLIPFSIWIERIGLSEGALCLLRHAGARCAGVVRWFVVLV